MLSSGIDCGDNDAQFGVAREGDFLEAAPEFVLNADAGFATGNEDVALADSVLHRASSSGHRLLRRLKVAAGPERSQATLMSVPGAPGLW